MVDEAKAFCPGCGHAFVEEEKRSQTSFEKLDHTVEFGKTMYNQMLSDMGLNISKPTNPSQKSIKVITSIKAEVTAPPAEVKVPAPAEAKVPAKEAVKPPEPIPDAAKSASNLKWYILIGVAVVFLLPVALATTIFLVIDIWSRFAVMK